MLEVIVTVITRHGKVVARYITPWKGSREVLESELLDGYSVGVWPLSTRDKGRTLDVFDLRTAQRKDNNG